MIFINNKLMKYVSVIAIVSVLCIVPFAVVLAGGHERPVTPYGDFCRRCGEYGNCKSVMSHDDAKKALIDYYHHKGLAVELERKRGRFIRAKVRDKNEVVDVIIFDRRSGRIRSIY
jgi:hypothetical protein